MPQINSETLKEYLVTGGKIAGDLALKFYGDSINEAGNKAFETIFTNAGVIIPRDPLLYVF